MMNNITIIISYRYDTYNNLLLLIHGLLTRISQESMYGKRDGALTGIAVLHQDKGNIYRKTGLWKQGVVDDIEMLPRASMFKPEVLLSEDNRSTQNML